MITITQAVQRVISTDPVVEEALSRGVINYSALARMILPEIEKLTFKPVTEGAIVMALKRMSASFPPPLNQRPAFNSSPNMIVRSNLFELTILNSQTLIDKQRHLLEITPRSAFLTTTTGVFETTLIASDELKDTIVELFKDEKQIALLSNLSSITIRLTDTIIQTTGSYSQILSLLALEGIKITEVVSTFYELTIILKDEDIDRAFTILKKTFKTTTSI